ncbi:hypothetical protein BDZ91DRAFT_720847 [Kalaharituber pfeilii]|nr:hypothetical protein BDZ91DRAFT_720847 [Kalaharituber pfeilii]
MDISLPRSTTEGNGIEQSCKAFVVCWVASRLWRTLIQSINGRVSAYHPVTTIH